MSDAQSIFIVLLGFYGFESLKFAAFGAYSIRSPLLFSRRWNPQRPTVQLMGVKKSVYLAPLLPWPHYQLMSAKVGESGHRLSSVKEIDKVKAKLSFLKGETAWLRLCSFLVFLNYLDLRFVLLIINYNQGHKRCPDDQYLRSGDRKV